MQHLKKRICFLKKKHFTLEVDPIENGVKYEMAAETSTIIVQKNGIVLIYHAINTMCPKMQME